MGDLLSSIGQGIGAVGGPLVSGGLSLLGGVLQSGAQSGMVQQQENFQEQMSNTAYQRSMADMNKAGLNPALMYGSGGAESTPSGASMPPPNVLGGVASSAIDAVTAKKQWDNIDSSTASNIANALNTTNKADISGVEAGVMKTAQSLLSGLELKLQNWGKTNATDSGITNLGRSLGSKASNGINGVVQDVKDWSAAGQAGISGGDSDDTTYSANSRGTSPEGTW